MEKRTLLGPFATRIREHNRTILKAKSAMYYSITLRSRTDAKITGWYDGSGSRWSTDHTRQNLFDSKHEAKLIRDELRRLCPRNTEVINVEPARVEEMALADLEI
jgi:hypothetical protein